MEAFRGDSEPVIQTNKHMLERYLKDTRHDGGSRD